MAQIYNGLKDLLHKNSLSLPLDTQNVTGSKIDIFNFPEYILKYRFTYSANKSKAPCSLRDPALDDLLPSEVQNIQWALVKNQIEFAYNTTPAIYYLWNKIFRLSPDDIKSWDDFQRIPPITKEHQRLLGWRNFLPAPIADFYCNGIADGKSRSRIDPNLLIDQAKWTGGTTAKQGVEYVQVLIPQADWRASVDTMERMLYPVKHIVESINMAVTTYDQRHIARPIFEAQLRRYGKEQMAMPVGCSDEAWIWMIKESGARCGVAPPADHPLKGIGWPGMLEACGKQFDLALMSSTVPPAELLRKMLEHHMTILNVGGDTASLPTYFSLINRDEYDPGDRESVVRALQTIMTLKIAQIAPSYTEIVTPVDLSFSRKGEEGVLLQTNCASVWVDGITGESCLVPALKSQMIRSSATGNLVSVISVDEFGRTDKFHQQILRYNDFPLDKNLMPIYGEPNCSGGSSTGGCAG